LNATVKTLSFMKSQFPGRKDFIQRTYRQSQSFRSLCEDYRDCFLAREYWRQQTMEGAGTLEVEYSQLLAKLDSEIRHWPESPA
jgi:hypothetical protein